MGSPDGSIGPDTFSARWTGRLMVDNNETYTFSAITDDGVRLWIDGYLVINYWQTGGVSIDGAIDLTSGLHDIKLAFFEDNGDAFVSLSWSSASTPQAIIPSDHLFPPDSGGTAPVLDWTGEANTTTDGIDPEIGDTGQTITYRVAFSDADGDSPMSGYPRVHILDAGDEIAGSPFGMTFESGDTSAIYSYSTTLLDGTDYTYYFDAIDATGLQAVATPTVPTPVAPLNGPFVSVSDTETVPNPVGEGDITIATSSGTLEDVSGVDPETFEGMPSGISFPYGMLSFRITGLALGETVSITLILPEPLSDDALWYWYNPATSTFVDITDSVTWSGTTATLSATDGGTLDSDGVENGVIDDPVGPSIAAEEEDKEGGGGGGGLCFIATAAYGNYLDPHVQVLREFRDDVLILYRPGRAFVAFYNEYSPPLAQFIHEHEAARTLTRWALTPVVFVIKYPLISVSFVFLAVGCLIFRRARAKRKIDSASSYGLSGPL